MSGLVIQVMVRYAFIHVPMQRCLYKYRLAISKEMDVEASISLRETVAQLDDIKVSLDTVSHCAECMYFLSCILLAILVFSCKFLYTFNSLVYSCKFLYTLVC